MTSIYSSWMIYDRTKLINLIDWDFLTVNDRDRQGGGIFNEGEVLWGHVALKSESFDLYDQKGASGSDVIFDLSRL